MGAIVLLSDGGENTAGMGGSGIGLDALQALRNRRLPVHTIGFGKEQRAHDVEMEDVSVAANATANARMSATVSLMQHGYTGQKATLTVRDGDKTLAEREITLAAGRAHPDRAAVLSRRRCGRKEPDVSASSRCPAKRTSATTR